MKIVVDAEGFFSITGHASELLAISGLAQDGIKYRHTDGGASAHAVKVSSTLTAGADRVWAEMSDVRHENATSPADEPESDADSRYRVISVREAAENHKVDPRTILRWKDRDPSMIASEHPYRLDPIAVDAYAADPARRRRAA